MSGKTRRYHAPSRATQAAATRLWILEAARELFVSQGFRVTMREVARQADVSVSMVELAFGTKAALLDAVVDVALAGDDDPVPILERDRVRRLQDLPTPEFLDAAAAGFAAGAARVAPVLRALEEGAHVDPSLTELSERMARQRAVMADWVVAVLVDRWALADDLSPGDAIEVLMVLLDPVILGRLLVDRGWDREHLTAWLTRTFGRLLLQQAR